MNRIFNRLIIYSFSLIMLIGSPSCKFSNQQDEILNTLEENGVEMPDNIKKSNSINNIDLMFVLSSLLGISLFGFFVYRWIKKKKDQFGFALGDIKDGLDKIKESEHHDKMNDDQKKNLEDIMKLFNK